MVFRVAAVSLLSCLVGTALAATPRLTPPDVGSRAVSRIDDYAAATEAARAAGGMLLVSIEPQGGASPLDRPGLEERFAAAATPWIFCRPDAAAAASSCPGWARDVRTALRGSNITSASGSPVVGSHTDHE